MLRSILIWSVLGAALTVPVLIAATSPLMAWRGPVYIAAGFAGVIAMGLLLVQPLLAGGFLPGLSARRARRLHVWVGAMLVAAVVAHVVGLWVTSPPDVVDVLLFRSPTPFSDWGAVAMWAVFVAAFLAALRRRVRISPKTWRRCHLATVTVAVVGSVVHALLIEGTMGTISKAVLCTLVGAALAMVVLNSQPWASRKQRKA